MVIYIESFVIAKNILMIPIRPSAKYSDHDVENQALMRKVVDTMFIGGVNKLTENKLRSYNDLIDTFIPKSLKQYMTINVYNDNFEYKIQMRDFHTQMPTVRNYKQQEKEMWPNDARIRNLNYFSKIYVRLTQQLFKRVNNVTSDIPIASEENDEIELCKIPIMLQSKLCRLEKVPREDFELHGESLTDPGGYYIIGGEKVIIAQERACDNKVMCHQNNSEAEIRSTKDQRFNPISVLKISVEDSKNGVHPEILKASVKFCGKVKVNIFVLFRALGVVSDQEIIRIIMPDFDTSTNSRMKNILIASAKAVFPTFFTKDDKLIKERIKTDIVDQNSAIMYLIDKMKSYKDPNMGYLKGMAGQGYGKITKLPIEEQIVYCIKTLEKEVLPHCGSSFYNKVMFMGYMTRKLLDCVCGLREWDKRDSLVNKRVDMDGSLLGQLFRTNLMHMSFKLRKLMMEQIKNSNPELFSLKSNVTTNGNALITTKIKTALMTGDFATSKTGGIMTKHKKGIGQVLKRLSLLDTISQLRHDHNPINKENLVPPRKFDGTFVNCFCPDETPERKDVGILKNFSLSAVISVDTNPMIIMNFFNKSGGKNYFIPIEKCRGSFGVGQRDIMIDGTKVFVNGNLIGVIQDSDITKTYEALLTARRHRIINPSVSISWDRFNYELMIWTDGGRTMYPAFIVNKDCNDIIVRGRVFNTWEDLFNPLPDISERTLYNGGCIEYLDANECEYSLISTSIERLESNIVSFTPGSTFLRYSHCIIHPQLIKGVVSQMIPFSDRNQTVRNCYQSNMGKQSMGPYVSNPWDRLDSRSNILMYISMPLADPFTTIYCGLSSQPHGFEVISSIQSYGGYNQEDSYIVNESSIARGLFLSLTSRTYLSVKKKDTSLTNVQFDVPEMSSIIHPPENLHTCIEDGKLNRNGVPVLGEYFGEKDVLIGKFIKDDDGMFKHECTIIRKHEEGYVDIVISGDEYKDNFTDDGTNKFEFIKVRLSDLRVPELGDKLASRHAQKGTAGIYIPQSDMPVTGYGMYPSIIMNNNAVPSRMTIGQLLETLASKAGAVNGYQYDATPFQEINPDIYGDVLEENGYNRYCEEIMYDGRTGQQIMTPIFIGPVFYQRLKHMVKDKVQCRDKIGRRKVATRQPTEGRSNDGAIRLGEMERDCLVAHGASRFLKERFVDSSDPFMVQVGKDSGQIIVSNPDKNMYGYEDKPSKEEVVEVQIPYATKQFMQILIASGIKVEIKPDI